MPKVFHFVSSHGKEMVCVDMGHDAVNIYSQKGFELLRAFDKEVLVVGAEEMAPLPLIERAKVTLIIPTYSASINVSSAFSTILGAMQMAKASS